MDKIDILIVEDEFIIAEDLRETLIGLGYNVVGHVDSYSGAVNFLKQKQPDIAIVDIQINGKKTGIDLGVYIRENYEFPFIFLSSFTDQRTISNAKECQPDAYLVKPFKEKELYPTIEVALFKSLKNESEGDVMPENNSLQVKDSIFIKKDSSFIKVKIEKIVYIKSEGNYLELILEDGKKCIIRSSLKVFESSLADDTFIRVHNSYVINTNFITEITNTTIFVNEHEIPISRNRKDVIIKSMNFFT